MLADLSPSALIGADPSGTIYVGHPVTRQLWVTDGTLGNTQQLVTTEEFRGSSFLLRGSGAMAGTTAVFPCGAVGAGPALCAASTGTVSRLATVSATVGATLQGFTRAASLAFFFLSDGPSGSALWRTDGTAAGTFVLRAGVWKDLQATATGVVGQVDNLGVGELWRSDGTVSGTVKVASFLSATARQHPDCRPVRRRR